MRLRVSGARLCQAPAASRDLLRCTPRTRLPMHQGMRWAAPILNTRTAIEILDAVLDEATRRRSVRPAAQTIGYLRRVISTIVPIARRAIEEGSGKAPTGSVETKAS